MGKSENYYFLETSLKMEYCEILFDLESIFNILIRAAS